MMTKELFEYAKDQSIHVVRLQLPDQLDAMEFDQLNSSLTLLLHSHAGGAWVVDLSAVTYMGSAVLGLMVNIRQQIKTAKGTLVLSGMSAPLYKIFSTCCLERLFTITKSYSEAMSLLRR
jgi:anti-anti-sigma factor